jgi:hypothetical protein
LRLNLLNLALYLQHYPDFWTRQSKVLAPLIWWIIFLGKTPSLGQFKELFFTIHYEHFVFYHICTLATKTLYPTLPYNNMQRRNSTVWHLTAVYIVDLPTNTPTMWCCLLLQLQRYCFSEPAHPTPRSLLVVVGVVRGRRSQQKGFISFDYLAKK